jgi:ankyrin repeat protein
VQGSALCVAVGIGQLEAAMLLLDAGADPDRAGSDGPSPLMMAAGAGYLEVLRLLLARGAAVDAAHPASGWTAFHAACFENQADCAEALARAGCNVGLKDGQGKTGRELAEAEGHAAVVERLRVVVAGQLRSAQAVGPAPEAGEPEPAAVVGDGGSADQLLEAVRKGDGAEMALLLSAGADPNALVSRPTPSGKVLQTTALGQAVGHGRLEAARLLMDGGADPSRANSNGATPLITAVGHGQLEVLQLLLARGAAVDAVHPRTGFTAFHAACFKNQAECAEALVRAGCDVRLKDGNGRTGREVAEEQGHAAVVERLRAVVAEQLRAARAVGIAPEPEPAAVIGDGGSASQLAQATLQGDGAAAARLLAAGADPNASMSVRLPSGEVYQTTALFVAASDGLVEAARLLLDAGADPSCAASDGGTPLMVAAAHGQLELLRLLLARGAAVDAADPRDGFTAGLDEGLLSFCRPQFSFLWKIPIKGTHSSAE